MVFVSKNNLELHREYLNTLKLQYSIFEKSYPVIKGKSCAELAKSSLNKAERNEALRLKCEITAHELFFDSFGEGKGASAQISKGWGSEANFLYELFNACMKSTEGFLVVFYDNKQRLGYVAGTEYIKAIAGATPCLALDLCEHAYFLDYCFNKDKYIKNALSNFNLSRLKS